MFGLFMIVLGGCILVAAIAGFIYEMTVGKKEKEIQQAKDAREKTKKENLEKALKSNEALEKKYDILSKDIVFSEHQLELWEEFLKAAGETYNLVRYYNNGYFGYDDYSKHRWETRIAVGKGRADIVIPAFNKWEVVRANALVEKREKEAEELVKKALLKDFDLKSFYEDYMKRMAENPTDEIELAEKWIAEGKKVFMRPIHPGIPNSEMGRESWSEFNYQVITENPGICWEFDYEERINQRGY